MSETTYKKGDVVVMTYVEHQPWLWLGVKFRLLEKTDHGQWKMETTSTLTKPTIHYFKEHNFQPTTT